MGWKTSLIIIENPKNLRDDQAILKAIDSADFKFDRELTLDDCLYPKDGSISIGYYNGNIIISDDYQITNDSLDRAKTLELTKQEKGLTTLFPASGIVSVACHSVVNYHAYSLIEKGQKVRLKTISSDNPIKEFGQRTPEENAIYTSSFQKDGKTYWKDETDPDDHYTEDQLMEQFTFEFAKRRLGVMIDHSEGDELREVTFKKYKKRKTSKWLKYGLIVLAFVAWQILKRTVLRD